MLRCEEDITAGWERQLLTVVAEVNVGPRRGARISLGWNLPGRLDIHLQV